MSITRGTRSFGRTHAKNYHFKETQQRLDETVAAFNRQSMNALSVDAVEVIVYNRIKIGKTCTCEETEVSQAQIDDYTAVPSILKSKTSVIDENVITIDRTKSIFGEISEGARYDISDELTEINQLLSGQDSTNGSSIANVLAGSNVDCGICYRQGTFPGFQPVNWTREVLTTHNFSNIRGYWVNNRQCPHTLERQDPNGFVEYSIIIPAYFTDVLFSIRNNHDILDERFYIGDRELTRTDLINNAGHPMTLYVKAEAWTHAIIAFNSGVKILANLSEISLTKDYAQFETVQGLTVVMPPNIANVNIHDIIYIPKFNYVLKVNDLSRKTTAKLLKFAEWSVATRVLQPQEIIKYIHSGFYL